MKLFLPRAGHKGSSAWAWVLALNLVAFMPETADAAPTLTAEQWLVRVQQAARSRNFAGISVNSAGGTLTTRRVVHVVENGQVVERTEMLDGEPHLTIRQDDMVHRLWPARRLAVVESKASRLSHRASAVNLDPRLHQFYEARLLGAERVIGREAQMVWLRPRDEFRLAQRLWVDVDTGLLLRSEVLNGKDEVLESVSFSTLDLNPRTSAAVLLEPLRKLAGYRVVQRQTSPTELHAEGWNFNAAVAGFELVHCVRRVLGGGPEQANASTDAPVLQAVFSDGLSNISLFIEPADRHANRKMLLSQHGATQTVMQALGNEHWVTAMGDVPPATLKQFIKGLERRR